jgi:hypothetical protein
MSKQGNFESSLIHVIEMGLRSISRKEAEDSYATSFWWTYWDDDPYKPALLVSTNTESQVLKLMEQGINANPSEIRWNFAYWTQRFVAAVGYPSVELAHSIPAVVRDEWVRGSESFSEKPTDANGEEWYSYLDHSDDVEQEFLKVCIAASRWLHSSGTIVEVFGRPIPILLHELESSSAAVESTEAANPPGLADDFLRSMLPWDHKDSFYSGSID